MSRLTMMAAMFGLIAAGPTWAVHLPAKAKSIKGEFVTAYGPCLAPDQSLNPPLPLPACVAEENNPDCGFGPGGSGKFKLTLSGTDIKLFASWKGLAAACEGLEVGLLLYGDITTTDCLAGECIAPLAGKSAGVCVVSDGRCVINTTLETFTGTGDIFKSGQSYNIRIRDITASVGFIPTFVAGIAIAP